MRSRHDGPMLRGRVHLQALNDAMRNLDHRGESTPCTGREEWISDDKADVETAKRGCQRCPIINTCRTAGVGQFAGVWGGRLHRQGGRNTDTDTDDGAVSA